MHIAVSAEARSRANREFRAIATSNPFIPLHPPSPPYLHRHRRSARLDFNFALIPLNIYPFHPPPTLPSSLLASSRLFPPLSPLPHLYIRACFSPLFSFFFFFSSSLSSPHDARRQLHDATNCSHVYRHIIIIRRESFHDSIIVRDLI